MAKIVGPMSLRWRGGYRSCPVMHEVGILLYDGVQGLDAVGPFEALHAASLASAEPVYSVRMLSLDGAPVRSETGILLGADAAIEDCPSLDTLIVPGGATARALPPDGRLVGEIARLAVSAERVVSICTGAYLVAAAGLASRKRVATHWKFARDLEERYPDVEVDADRLYVQDGPLFSSAGILAGIDLTLALVEADLGEMVATAVARELVIYLRRTGGQAQFSEPLKGRGRLTERLALLSDTVRENLDADLSVEQLAARMGLSARHLRRVLKRDAGASPAQFVESIRLDVAREILGVGDADIKQIAATVGYGGSDQFRRAFRKRYGLSPGVYRERFSMRPGDSLRMPKSPRSPFNQEP